MNPMGDPGRFDSESAYSLERHFPLQWRRGVAVGDCARDSRIGRGLFLREGWTCARDAEGGQASGRRFDLPKRFFLSTGTRYRYCTGTDSTTELYR